MSITVDINKYCSKCSDVRSHKRFVLGFKCMECGHYS